MPVRCLARTPSDLPDSRVPDALRGGTLVLGGFRRAGLLDAVEDRLPLARRAGHGTRSIFSSLVAFLLAGRAWGIRPFLQKHAGLLRSVVAPVAGLRALASSSAISRALSDLRHDDVRAFGDWLLRVDARVGKLLTEATVLHRDAFGEGWHVVDVDPTIEAFRQRPLEEDDTLPDGVRLAPGEPGYTGHKRGELRIRHVPLLHAGAGLWLAYRLVEEEGSVVPVLAELLKVGLASLPGGRTIVRGDGEFGSVGAMRTVADAGAHHLTRLSRYTLLDREDVVAAFPGLSWHAVPSAGAGPVREAAELGEFEFHPSEGAAGTGESVVTRVVVTRFRRSSPPDHGVLRGGHQIELFATSLSADAWPAGDVVALYFGRGAIENRFAQEDREFGIDRTFSMHPAGQEWVVFIAYFLWNLMVCEGTAAAAALPNPPRQEPRPPDAATTPGLPPRVVDSAEIPPRRADAAPLSPPPPRQEVDLPASEDAEEAASEVWRLVRDAIVLRKEWRHDDDAGVLRCPTGKRHYVFAAYPSKPPHTTGNRILLRGEAGACDGCPLRDRCSSHKPGTYKQLAVVVSETDALRARALLARGREERPRRPAPRRPERVERAPHKSSPTATRLVGAREGQRPQPGPLTPASPLFLPAAARALARDLLHRATLDVYVGRVAPLPRAGHRLVASDAADRRHRRRSWNQRRARWAVDPDVFIVVTGPRTGAVRNLLSSLTVGGGA